MMEKMNKWLSAHKKLCVITGIFGLLVSPFLWPVFLAVIIHSLSLVIPVAAGLFFYEKFIMKKDKEETNENDDDNKQQKNHADASKVHADAEKTEDLPKNHEKGSETVNFDNQEKQARCRAQAAIWYEKEGFERIQAIRKTLESENRNRFSVNREGICSISIGKRNLEPNFRRNEGLDVELTGDWKPTKYGMQYSVSNFSVTMPTTKEGIRTYLSSSLIKGIGPAMAARIVETFGEDTLNVFNDSPEKLLQVKGITQKRLDDILEGYQKSSSIRELMMYLSPFGVTPAKVSKIQEKFGPAAVMIVKEEPFRLCEVHGFGFLTVDQIAVKAKHFRADDPLRIKAAILHSAGHTGVVLLCREISIRKSEVKDIEWKLSWN